MEFLLSNQVAYCLSIFTLAMLLSWAIMPSVLHVARSRHLYDDIGHFRKQHDHGIPRLGGVAIFVSFAIITLVFNLTDRTFPLDYLLAASIILFILGIKDDLSGVNSSTKLIIQSIVALILVLPGNIRLAGMYGIFNVYELPFFISCPLSVLVIILIVNAFNLIDGIDGLAAMTGILVNTVFAILLGYIKQYELAAISLILVGAIAGFLYYNITPAKIFMGDSGSLFIGLVSVVMAIKLIELNQLIPAGAPQLKSAPAITIAILIGPIFDTMRVFFLRILKGVSPFTADRNHIHHRLLKLGFNHLQICLVLLSINIAAIGLALRLNNIGNSALILIIFILSLLSNWMITFFIRSRERGYYTMRNFIV